MTHATERTRRSTPPRVPDGYGLVEATRRRALVWHEASSWAEERLRSDATLLDWAAQEPARSEMRGRGNVYVVPAPAQGPDGRDRWVVRHYHRGGAMAAHMEDRYLRLGRLRPWRELAAVAEARARGVPTPAVVCGAAYLGGHTYTADFVTELVADATTLADALHRYDGTRGWTEALARAATLVDVLAQAGVLHVDLNAHNILLREGEAAWVVDLDRARILAAPSRGAADRMRARLVRSILKIGTPTGEPLSVSEVEAALDSAT